MIWRIRNSFSSIIITGNLHKCVSWIKLLAELNNALQIVIKNVSIIKIQIWLTKSFLVTFDHHKYNFLIVIWTFEEIRQIALFLNFFSSFHHWISIFYILIIIFIITMNLQNLSSIIFELWRVFSRLFPLFSRLLYLLRFSAAKF